MRTQAVTKYQIVAIEGDHVFGPSEAQNMRLPFNYGWECWALVQNKDVVMLSPKFEIIEATYKALVNMDIIYETQH